MQDNIIQNIVDLAYVDGEAENQEYLKGQIELAMAIAGVHQDQRENFEWLVEETAKSQMEWGKAQVLLDSNHDLWIRRYGNLFSSPVMHNVRAEDLWSDFGPLKVLVNQRGHVVIDTMLMMNDHTKTDLIDRLREDVQDEGEIIAPSLAVEKVLEFMEGDSDA